MKVTIEIPDEFREHYNFDKFKDSFMRIRTEVSPKANLSGRYERELLDMLIDAFGNSIETKDVNQ